MILIVPYTASLLNLPALSPRGGLNLSDQADGYIPPKYVPTQMELYCPEFYILRFGLKISHPLRS